MTTTTPQVVLKDPSGPPHDNSKDLPKAALQTTTAKAHRSYGAFLIQKCCQQTPASFPQRVMVTACHIFQVFYCYCEFQDHDVRYTAIAALSLACKTEECRISLKLLMGKFSTALLSSQLNAGSPDEAEKFDLQLQAKKLVQMEKRVLRVLGFDLVQFCSYNREPVVQLVGEGEDDENKPAGEVGSARLPDGMTMQEDEGKNSSAVLSLSHAHTQSVLYELFNTTTVGAAASAASPRAGAANDERTNLRNRSPRRNVGLSSGSSASSTRNQALLTKAIAYANDSLRTDLRCLYSAEVVAKACLELARRDLKEKKVFLAVQPGSEEELLLTKVMREILEVYEYDSLWSGGRERTAVVVGTKISQGKTDHDAETVSKQDTNYSMSPEDQHLPGDPVGQPRSTGRRISLIFPTQPSPDTTDEEEDSL
ncbi:unnamed protein product [Amoebophrya sp. A120]|nr:unnamed protein product [Amoebophrya sp. A120]|eukprot:GSA120T00025836001.1